MTLEDLRRSVADIMDEGHGPQISEGGCEFRALHFPMYGDRGREPWYDSVVDLVIKTVLEHAQPPAVELVGLKPGTLYHIEVTGHAEIGSGKPSELVVTTRPAEPDLKHVIRSRGRQGGKVHEAAVILSRASGLTVETCEELARCGYSFSAYRDKPNEWVQDRHRR
jgi:hypothetical protein